MSRADQPGDADDEPFERAESLERRSLAGAIRDALFDVYHHSIRLVPANVLWGLVLIGLGWGALTVGLWLPILGLPLLGLPLIGIYRLTGHITRGEEVVLSDALAAAREQVLPAFVAAAAIGWSLLLLAFNVIGGLNSGSTLGWILATLAGWAFVALAMYAVVLWPVLGDPERAGEPAGKRARLAGYLVVAAPFRAAGLTVVAVALWVVSTIAFAAIVTITVAYVACLSSRLVLPDADRLSARLAERRPH